MTQESIKHLIQCKCILPQFKNTKNPIFHKFLVFSIIDENGDIIPSYASCNNCNVVHRVVEVNQSQILKKEDTKSILTIEDIKTSLPEKIVGILEAHECQIATWQEVSFILENKLWGRGIVLAKETEGALVSGKYMVILGENLYKIEPFERDEGLI